MPLDALAILWNVHDSHIVFSSFHLKSTVWRLVPKLAWLAHTSGLLYVCMAEYMTVLAILHHFHVTCANTCNVASVTFQKVANERYLYKEGKQRYLHPQIYPSLHPNQPPLLLVRIPSLQKNKQEMTLELIGRDENEGKKFKKQTIHMHNIKEKRSTALHVEINTGRVFCLL